jgi:hypothetical protein
MPQTRATRKSQIAPADKNMLNLRGVGLSPWAPGVSQGRDEVQLAAAGSAAVRSVRKRPQVARPYAVWTPPAT